MTIVLEEIQEQLGYRFHNPRLLEEALTHKSYLQYTASAESKHNERLEFLGDAVVGLVISDFLASVFPNSSEGELSKMKARLVSRVSLSQAAQRMKLGNYLQLGPSEEATSGRLKGSLLGNALEALMGAVYQDGGFESARTVVLRVLGDEIDVLQSMAIPAYVGDFKSRLQELCQKVFNALPHYRVIQECGPDHDKEFEVEVGIQGKICGKGTGKSKKEAEQLAAQQALINLNQERPQK